VLPVCIEVDAADNKDGPRWCRQAGKQRETAGEGHGKAGEDGAECSMRVAADRSTLEQRVSPVEAAFRYQWRKADVVRLLS